MQRYRHYKPFNLNDSIELVDSLSVEDKFFEKSRNSKLYNVISQLSRLNQRRIYLYYAAGMTLEKIAELDRVSHFAVSKSISKSRKKLRELLCNCEDYTVNDFYF